jgi:hypothetical protein
VADVDNRNTMARLPNLEDDAATAPIDASTMLSVRS